MKKRKPRCSERLYNFWLQVPQAGFWQHAAYGANREEAYRRVVRLVARYLRGAKVLKRRPKTVW